MRPPAGRSGFTLIESMLALVVLAVAALVVPVALQTLAHTPAANDSVLAVSAELASEIETWRAEDWGPAPWPATLPYSATDTVTIKFGGGSATLARTVSIKNWDPNNLITNSSPQADFARIQVTIGAQTATAFTTRPF